MAEPAFDPQSAALIGIRDALHLPDPFTASDLARRSFEGVPVEIVEAFAKLLPRDVVFRVLGAERTLRRRIAGRKALRRDESDRALRLFRILALAESVFGDFAKAMRWLTKPKATLDPDHRGQAPVALLETEHGARLVEERLRQIEHGVYA